MTIHTPNAGTGLTGSWHVGNPITVRADLALSEPGSLGGVQWLEDVPDGYWRELADLLWVPNDDPALPEGFATLAEGMCGGRGPHYCRKANSCARHNACVYIHLHQKEVIPADTSPRRRPSEQVKGAWLRLGHLLVAPLGLRLVVVPAWVAPALYRPDGTRRPCSVVTRADGRSVVVVSDGGDVVAFVPVVGVGAR